MKSKIISGITAISLTLTAFVSLGITASAANYNASALAVGNVLVGGVDTIKQNGGTTAWVWKSLLKLTYCATDGTQINYSETEDGKSTTVYRSNDGRYVYWRVTSTTKENHDLSRDDYIVTLTANDPYVDATSTNYVWTGAERPLITVNGSAGIVQYSLDGENWSTTVPTASEIGSYTVYYKALPGSNTNNVYTDTYTLTSTITARGASVGETKASEISVGDVFTGGVDSIYQDGGTSVIWHSLLKLSYCMADGTEMGDLYTETEDGQSTPVYKSDSERYVYWTATSKTSNVIDYYGQFPRTDYIITLTARDPSVTTKPEGKTVEWTGEPQDLITAGEVTNGTIQYSLDGENWSTTVPKATDIGFYMVYYKVDGNASYNNLEATGIVSVIMPKKATATYKNEGDFVKATDRASAWSVTVTPGSSAITSLDVKVNGQRSKEGAWNDSTVIDGTIQFAVAVNVAAERVESVTAVVDGDDIETTLID